MANPIAKEISEDYGFSSRKTASLLDTFSCIMQGILPYGAQMLIALSVIATLGYSATAFDIIPYLIYPLMLLVSVLAFIFIIPSKDRPESGEPECVDAAKADHPANE
jgi:Na+/H+ antiporter NhaC